MAERPVAPLPAHAVTRALMKFIALYSGVPWPKGRIRTMPEVDPRARGTKPDEFEADRRRLLGTIDRFVARDGSGAWADHPMFGRMSAAAWLRWGYLHADHHLRQFGV